MQSYELQYKRLFSVISRVGDSHPEKQGSKLGLGIFFFFFFFVNMSILWVYYTINLLYRDKECMVE